MDQFFIVIVISLAILAVIDLVVGVSNDAVNFLNSAIGSKAVSFKTIMIVASLGVACGAVFSGGMMEIARSGIFVPSMFSYKDVMIIFLAVMITDILLLDIFNSLGLPTSTTVSIIFELLGASVCLALYKIYSGDLDISTLQNYINTDKASEIVVSILLSVFLSFTIGGFVQYFSRLIFTFQYEKKLKYIGASNEATILRNLYFVVFNGSEDSVKMTFERNGIISDKYINRYYFKEFKYQWTLEGQNDTCKILDGNIGYVNLGLLQIEQVKEVMEKVRNTQAIIFDL